MGQLSFSFSFSPPPLLPFGTSVDAWHDTSVALGQGNDALWQDLCHGPECSGSRRAPVESMAVVQSPWRPWTPTDSHAKEDRAHMRGGPATKRTKLKEQAQPRRGQSSRSRHSHKEDQAQGACRWLPLRGSRDKSQRNHHWSKEEEQCIGDRQVGPEEEEQCRRSRHSSGGQEWC
ncbi:uncharacterized protein UDID_17344 [Ustilago sp. UG-2017a]|nr:uncharacterized protein UDID_17344 [Ustilago sp. UG-2017a]